MTALALAACLALSGCPNPDPAPFNPGDTNTPQGPFYADTVLALRTGGAQPTLCDDIQRTCPMVQNSVECPNNPALGKPDDNAFTVGPSSSIDLGFQCSLGIREIGGTTASDDFTVTVTSIDENALPVVQVSNDGSNYSTLNLWPKDLTVSPVVYKLVAGFKLEAQGLINVRYVRIAETSGNGSISVDGVTALALQISK